MIDAKKKNKDLKENISADLFNSHFTKNLLKQKVFIYTVLYFLILHVIVGYWVALLYSEFVGK